MQLTTRSRSRGREPSPRKLPRSACPSQGQNTASGVRARGGALRPPALSCALGSGRGTPGDR
eukprot:4653620-Pyramimonas_sp.AAC.1